MAVTTTALGPNSYQLDYTNGTTATELMAALEAAIIDGHGWEVHDASPGGTGTAKCFKALNKDGTTYKFVIVRINANSLTTEVYENWNATTHVGTNMAYLSNDANSGSYFYTTQSGQLFLFVSPRWLGLLSRNVMTGTLGYLNTSFQGAHGCFEISRDNAEDTAAAGYPCAAFLNTAWFQHSPDATAGFGYLPRNRSNSVGSASGLDVSSIFAKAVGATNRITTLIPSVVNPWNNKDWALTIYVHESTTKTLRGRFYGLKLFTHNKYLLMDRAVIKVDADFLYSAVGTDTDHHIIETGHNTSRATRILIPI
jgi:hypothetical protein